MKLLAFLHAPATNLAVTNTDIQNYLQPLMLSLVGLAGIVSAFFIIIAGISYMTSRGSPEKLEHAKKVLKNALIGLVIVIAAGTITGILNNAYQSGRGDTLQNVPTLSAVDTSTENGGLTEVLLKAIVGLFKNIVETAGKPFIAALDFFTHSTPLMAQNPSVFKIWLAVLAIANSLFVLVVALLGFHIMSAATLGLDELEFKHLLPRLGLTFLGMNMSIFLIDIIIGISNSMIVAVEKAFSSLTVWEALSSVVSEAGGQGLVALLIMVVFLILTTMLLVYYVMRIVTLYVGAILSPLAIMLSVLPGFRDFSATAAKVYVTNIFVLFIHVIILTLAATLFAGLKKDGQVQPYDPIMATVIGVATLIALLKTQGVLMQLSYVSAGPRALRKLGGQFMNGVHYTSTKIQATRTPQVSNPGVKTATKTNPKGYA
jgi:hypothetical protein